MAYQTYSTALAAQMPGALPLMDPLVALSGLVAFGSRLRTAPPSALAFLRHADALLRGTENAPGPARNWDETVLFAERVLRRGRKIKTGTAAGPRTARRPDRGWGWRRARLYDGVRPKNETPRRRGRVPRIKDGGAGAADRLSAAGCALDGTDEVGGTAFSRGEGAAGGRRRPTPGPRLFRWFPDTARRPYETERTTAGARSARRTRSCSARRTRRGRPPRRLRPRRRRTSSGLSRLGGGGSSRAAPTRRRRTWSAWRTPPRLCSNTGRATRRRSPRPSLAWRPRRPSSPAAWAAASGR